MKLFIVYLIVINIVGFVVFGTDKSAARKHRWRIPEHILMFIAAFGGVLGCLAGMYLFRHKTLHVKFRIGLPLILICWIALILFILLR